MTSYLITGSSRGLGLTLASLLAQRPPEQVRIVLATARKESTALRQLKEKHPDRVVFVPLDSSQPDSINQAVTQIQQMPEMTQGLDILINNAGVLNWTEGGMSKMTDLMSTFDVNVKGPHIVTTAFLPLLRLAQKRLVVNISSITGSITLCNDFYFGSMNNPAYKVSKAALNMLTRQWALSLADEGFTFFSINPGWLKTDIGGGDIADLPVEVGAEKVLDILDRSTQSDSGSFLDIHVPGWKHEGKVNRYEGGKIPW